MTPHSIDDVPILALTLHSASDGPEVLRQVAAHLDDEIRTIPDVAATYLIGGRPRQLRVTLDPARLAGAGVSPREVAMALQGANARLPAGEFSARDRTFLVTVGTELRSADDVASVAVAERGGRTVRVRDVATLVDGPAEVVDYVGHAERGGEVEHAVTLAVAKRPGANATALARTVLSRVEQARARLVPPGITLSVTRDYGETAREKVNELILAPPPCHRLGVGAHLAVPRLARSARRAGRHSGHARAHALHVLSLWLHPQPHHALRADLLHRHPGGRRDRRGGEHRPPRCSCGEPSRATGRDRVEPSTKSATRPSSPPSR